jgi:protein-disulfide isomerase
MTPATIVAALTSRKGLVLLVPAILLVGTVLAIGRNETSPVQTPKAEQGPPPTTTVGPTPSKTTVADAALGGAQRKEIEGIVKDYLAKNPEILVEMQNALEAKEYERQAQRTAAVIKENAKEVFQPAASPIVGNSKGDVTVLEFFDYNCGYCKRALGDVARLIEKDKQVKFILKELPILAKGSEETAKVALAAKMQGKYWEFHRAMLGSTGQANEASALRAAEKIGLDMAKLKKDMASPAVQKEIDDTQALAKKLGVNGTPYFLVADKIIPGAPENLLDRMSKLVAEVRKEGCKVC